ncbi:MAG: META domain-containing protein, partial [Pseudomonadales bacterium]|nr:META domain-containing protein [Pseudomonadales bacterium]
IEARSPAGVLWQVEDIDGGGIIDSSHMTLQIADDTGISGSTGCNRYFGAVVIAGSAFEADAIGTTRMACAPALMQQEQRFVQALQAVRRFELSGDFLLLYDESQVLRLRLIATDEPGPTTAPG